MTDSDRSQSVALPSCNIRNGLATAAPSFDLLSGKSKLELEEPLEPGLCFEPRDKSRDNMQPEKGLI